MYYRPLQHPESLAENVPFPQGKQENSVTRNLGTDHALREVGGISRSSRQGCLIVQISEGTPRAHLTIFQLFAR